jgi:hypothetical protein
MVEGQRMTENSGSVDQEARRVVVAAKTLIFDLGGAWMTGESEEVATEAAGLEDWQLYFLGRHGVLGDVDADVITAAAYVFPPDRVRSQWEAARRTLTPEEAVRRYAEVCHEWGRSELKAFDGAERLTDLAGRVVDAVAVAGLPLFAGWRALSLPADPLAKCAHMMQLLREHRGACHGLAMVALGLHPLVAILLDKAENAEEYGWERPYPTTTDHDRQVRAQVEEVTDDLVTPPYASLTAAELRELLDLLGSAHKLAFG